MRHTFTATEEDEEGMRGGTERRREEGEARGRKKKGRGLREDTP